MDLGDGGPAAGPALGRGGLEALQHTEPEVVVRRQEALAAARLRMQEELNAQAEKYKEKQKQLEEERRRQKIAMWESMQEGKSYKGNLKLNQQEVESGASSASAVPKSKPNKKPLRGGVFPGGVDHPDSLNQAITPCLEKEEGRAPGDPAGGARPQVDEANIPGVPWHWQA
ncbi:hypothetical protein DV515_00006472 [Chloebia gouldiae]|uniref:Selenoprotein S n=1 Tax=Chloebia gouldiae TaxID=44316 RepID=A0A3L8SKP1_CHLGU|nr:hypothetical protein DV515_00006472 [Chloebia gouldiae]